MNCEPAAPLAPSTTHFHDISGRSLLYEENFCLHCKPAKFIGSTLEVQPRKTCTEECYSSCEINSACITIR